jgi:hypothetical protein
MESFYLFAGIVKRRNMPHLFAKIQKEKKKTQLH